MLILANSININFGMSYISSLPIYKFHVEILSKKFWATLLFDWGWMKIEGVHCHVYIYIIINIYLYSFIYVLLEEFRFSGNSSRLISYLFYRYEVLIGLDEME